MAQHNFKSLSSWQSLPYKGASSPNSPTESKQLRKTKPVTKITESSGWAQWNCKLKWRQREGYTDQGEASKGYIFSEKWKHLMLVEMGINGKKNPWKNYSISYMESFGFSSPSVVNLLPQKCRKWVAATRNAEKDLSSEATLERRANKVTPSLPSQVHLWSLDMRCSYKWVCCHNSPYYTLKM